MVRSSKRRKTSNKIIIAVLAVIIICGLTYVAFKFLPQNSPIQLNPSESIPVVLADPESIPEYNGVDYIILNDNIPNFTDWDLENTVGEHYSNLDPFGRCGKAYAMLSSSMIPTGERGDISNIRPAGFKQQKYEDIINSDPPMLYHRGHLIAWALGGDDRLENITTLTEYTNTSSMLSWENQVIRFLHDSNLNVLYRVTPYYKGPDLVCRGLEMEAFSVEDKGRSICFHVFVYNVEPNIVIDYKTGNSKASDSQNEY